jgi:hypothetical protein
MNSMQAHHPESHSFLGGVHLEMLGWTEVERREQSGLWQDVDGDLLGLARIEGAQELPPLSDEGAVIGYCSMMAESMGSRLVEAAVFEHRDGRAILFVCRQLKNWALVFTGILMVPTRGATWIWSMTAVGQPVTGDLRHLCEDCLCPAHPLARVRQELRKLLGVRLLDA